MGWRVVWDAFGIFDFMLHIADSMRLTMKDDTDQELEDTYQNGT